MKALLVDDDAYVRQCLRMLIPWEKVGVRQVIDAVNGGQAYELALKEHPDLIITDIKMPVMDGLTMVGRLKEILVDTYVILLSAYSDFQYAQEAIRYGVSDYVLKPFTKERIEELSGKILQVSREFEKKRQYRQLILDRQHLEASIQNALDTRDTGLVASFFETELPSMNLRLPDLKDLCLQLYDVLDQYMLRNNYRPKDADTFRERARGSIERQKNAEELISSTCRLWIASISFMIEKTARSPAYVKEMCEYISGNYMDEDLCVARVAKALHLSPVYAGVLFKQERGISITSYINQLRVEKALELLSRDGMSIANVGRQVGYINRDYFTKVFRKITGMTPSDCRSLRLSNIVKPAKEKEK